MHPTKSVALIGPALREAATTSSAKNADEYLQILKSLHGNLAASVSPIVYCTVLGLPTGGWCLRSNHANYRPSVSSLRVRLRQWSSNRRKSYRRGVEEETIVKIGPKLVDVGPKRGTTMVEGENGDDYRLTLARQLFGNVAAISGRNPPGRNEDPEIRVAAGVVRHSPASEISPSDETNLKFVEETQQRQLKTAAELSEMIEQDLAHHPDCPKAGFQVTVYGWPYWRAMLTIKPAAGAVRNPQEWRALTNELAERLRKRYDLAWE